MNTPTPTTTGTGSKSAVQIDQESANVRRWSAIHALDFALFGGECVINGKRSRKHPADCAGAFRGAFSDLVSDGIGRKSDAARLYALRGHSTGGDVDSALARLAAAYGIGSARQ